MAGLRDLTAYRRRGNILTEKKTLRGMTGVCLTKHVDLADWEWDWIGSMFGWIRIDGGWATVESVAGTYDWSSVDEWVDAAESRGLGTVIILDYANTVYGFTDNFYGPSTAAQRTAFVNWALSAAAQYQNRPVIFEIWNEPHNEGFWKPFPDAASYAMLARQTIDAVKLAYPEQAILTGGGLALQDMVNQEDQTPYIPGIRAAVKSDLNTGPWYLEYDKDVQRYGGFNGADAVSFHLYSGEWPPEVCKRQLATLRSFISLPIVDSEHGFSDRWEVIGSTGYFRPGDKRYNQPMGEDRAALYTMRMILAHAADGIPLTNVFAWRDIQTSAWHESRKWVYKPQRGKDSLYTAFNLQQNAGAWGLVEHDPDDPAYTSSNVVDEFYDEYYLDSVEVIQPGSCYCEPSVTALAGTPGGTAVVGYSEVGTAVVGTSKLNRGQGAIAKAAVAGNSNTGEVNDVVLEQAGTGYEYGFNLTVTDPDPAKSTGTINCQATTLYTGEAGPVFVSSTPTSAGVSAAGGMTAPYLRFTGRLPYDTAATASLISMNVGGVTYIDDDETGAINKAVQFTGGTKCLNGVDGYGWVTAVEGGCLTRTAASYGSIMLGTGKGLALDEICSNASSLNGDGTSTGLEVKCRALAHTALGIGGNSAGSWAINAAGSGYRVGEAVTFGTYSGSGSDVAVIVTAVDGTGGVTAVYGLYGGTYESTTLPTGIQIADTANTWTTAWTTISSANIVPWFTPNVIKVLTAGAGYDVAPAVRVTTNVLDTGPSTGYVPYGAMAEAVLSNTGTVEFIKPANSSCSNGMYYTKAPTISVVAGHPSIITRTRSYGGEVTDVFVDGPGLALSPTQYVEAEVVGGKWPCLVAYDAGGGTWSISTSYAGQKYTSGKSYVAYDIGTSVPVDAVTGDLDQAAVWDACVTANATVTFYPTCDSDGVVTALGSASGTPPADGHVCVLADSTTKTVGEKAVVGLNIRPRPKPRQPKRRATVLRDLMTWLGDYTYSTNLSTNDKAYHCVFTKQGRNDIHVLWRTTETLPEATAKVVDGAIAFVTITEPGIALTEEPTVTFTDATGTGAAAHCLMFDGGNVCSVIVDEAGSGYSDDCAVTFSTATVEDVTCPIGAVRAWSWTGLPVTLTDTITLTDEPLFIEVER